MKLIDFAKRLNYLLGLLSAISGIHLGVGDEGLGLELGRDGVTGRHDVSVVNILHERLHAEAVLVLENGLISIPIIHPYLSRWT